MSLLKKLVQEMDAPAATGATSIAATQGSLFSGGVVDGKKSKKKQGKMLRRIMNMKESLGADMGETDFDASDVISRIDAASKKSEQNEDTTVFGMEDEDGNLVKVYVRNDQAEDFEQQLASLLAGADEDNDNKNAEQEIAEVLFKLKDQFDIVDVEWPGIDGDEEEEQEVQGQGVAPAAGGAPQGDPAAGDPMAGGEDPMAGGEGGDDMENLDGEEGDGGEEDMAADEESAKSALQSVIDMMKSDAEAKKAEADARAAEARAKEAEYAGNAAASRVKKDEQIFDMEAEEKVKKDQKKEAEQLAKLARYQHQQAQGAEMKLSMEGKAKEDDDSLWKTNAQEEDDEEISLKELSQLIIRNLGHN